MQGSSTAPPPPYQTDTSPTETTLPTNSPVILAHSNLEAVRNSILDNAPVLYILGHNGYKPLPKSFHIATVKAPPNAVRPMIPGRFHACLMFCEPVSKQQMATRMFVQSPQQETVEEALCALLAKTQEMLGRRWWQFPLRQERPTAPYVYLES